jgi:hypothetical protein
MLRKLSLVILAAALIGATALAPSSASAFGGGWHGGGWHGHWGGAPIFVGSPGYYGYSGCLVRQWVPTPFGPRLRLVNRCY